MWRHSHWSRFSVLMVLIPKLFFIRDIAFPADRLRFVISLLIWDLLMFMISTVVGQYIDHRRFNRKFDELKALSKEAIRQGQFASAGCYASAMKRLLDEALQDLPGNLT